MVVFVYCVENLAEIEEKLKSIEEKGGKIRR